jgi:hypothetical protein
MKIIVNSHTTPPPHNTRGFSKLDLGISGFKFEFIKSYDGESFHLVVIPNDKSELVVFPNFASYVVGYSQGTGRSERGYYLRTPSGGASNGSGKSSKSVPNKYDLSYDIPYIEKYLKGKSGYGTDWYEKNAQRFDPKTKTSEIRNAL